LTIVLLNFSRSYNNYLKELFVLQTIYDQVLFHYDAKVWQRVLFKNMKKSMETARAEDKLSATPHLAELIAKFEAREVSEKFRGIYQGHVVTKIKGKNV
jgi:hypothetical protein